LIKERVVSGIVVCAMIGGIYVGEVCGYLGVKEAGRLHEG
jgi:hypothetical protein